MGIFNKLYRDIFCEQFMYGTHNSLTKLLRTQVAVKVRSAHTYCAHILLSRVTVGGDNHAAQRAYGSHQAGAFFFFLFLSDLCLPLAPVTHCCWVDLTVVTLADKDGFSKLVIDWFYKGDVGIKAPILTEVWSTCGIIKSSYFVHSTVTVSFVTLRSFAD